MISPAYHPLVSAPAAIALTGAGAFVGVYCFKTVLKIYEYAKCSFCKGKLYGASANDAIISTSVFKSVDCFKKRDTLLITICATVLSLAITSVAITIFAASAPLFIQEALVLGAIGGPLVCGFLRMAGRGTGAVHYTSITINAKELSERLSQGETIHDDSQLRNMDFSIKDSLGLGRMPPMIDAPMMTNDLRLREKL